MDRLGQSVHASLYEVRELVGTFIALLPAVIHLLVALGLAVALVRAVVNLEVE